MTETGYDLAVLMRPAGEARFANVRKLMRLAASSSARGPRPARPARLAARATEAAPRPRRAPVEGHDGVRIMTVHNAKGLEFEVVASPTSAARAAGGPSGCCSAPTARSGSGSRRRAAARRCPRSPTSGWRRPWRAGEDAEDRRLFYVAMTRAREPADPVRDHRSREAGPAAPGGPPIDWILPALIGVAPEGERVVHSSFDGRPTRVLARLVTPATIAPDALTTRVRSGTPGTALPARPKVVPAPSAGRPAPQRLSYTALGQYAKCPYRFYLQRSLRLPPVTPPFAEAEAAPEAAAPGLDARVRGVIAHRLLEELDFARPGPPAPAAVAAIAAEEGAEPTDAEVEDIREIVAAFGASPLCARIAASASIRREAAFSFPLEPAAGALVTGVVDVLAGAPGGAALVVDYKSDRLGDHEPHDVVERDYATQRIVYALAAPAVGRARGRGGLLRSSSARTPRSPRPSPTATSPPSRSASPTSPRACSRAATRSPPSPTARSVATAPAARRCARGPRR